MSTGSRKKGKERTKAVFVESSAQMTKSRNMAEENILRHKLKDLEVQRRRSILAMKGEEKLLIRDLETQRRGSLTQQTTDSDKAGVKKDQLEARHSNNSRRNSYKSSDENDNTISNAITTTMNQANEIYSGKNISRRPSVNPNGVDNDENATEGRKHLWKYPKSSIKPSREEARTRNLISSKRYPSRIHSEDGRLHMSDFVKDLSSETNNKRNSCDNIISPSSRSNKNDLSPRPSGRSLASLSNSLLSRTKSIDFGGADLTLNTRECMGSRPEMTSTPKDTERPTKARTKSDERRDRSMMSLAKRAGSLKWSSFEEFDNELNSAYGMIDKHAKKMSRSVNINIGEEQIDKKTFNYTPVSKSISEHSHSSGSATKDIHRLANSLQHASLCSPETQTSIPTQSLTRNGACQPLSNRSSQQFDNKLTQDPLENIASGSNDRSINRHKTNSIERPSTQDDNDLSPSKQTELNSSKDFARRNSVGRNKIMLSPIGSRTTKSQSNYIPSCAEKQPVKKPSKKKKIVNDKREPLKFSTANHATSDSDSGGSNVSRRGSIPDSHRKSSIPNSLDLPVRPVSSWSQRKRSIVFGEKSPQTAREVLNDTQAQWEELGDFLGEIRKQHNVDHARLSSSRLNCKAGGSSPTRPGDQPRRGSNFATLVEQRLLPRRHSESNIILLSHAAKGKKDILDLRQGATLSHSRRKSLIPPDLSSCAAVAGHATNSSTSVKKLVTIHNALQSSAMSMADMESELF